WPGTNISSDKVPSELAYDTAGIKRNSDGRAIKKSESTRTQKIRWGHQLKPEDNRLMCLKLDLEPKLKRPSFVSKDIVGNQLMLYGKTSEEAISDYLTEVFKYARDEMINRCPVLASTQQIDVVLTVPAIWSDAAKDATFRVAEKAGMGTNLFMISEPEAAAIYAFEEQHRQGQLKVGEVYIICDSGGGTTDLISFEVVSLTPLKVREAAPGMGALCGGVYLNRRFEDLVRSRMGSDKFDAFRKRKPQSWPIAIRFFEDYVKRNFDPKDSQDEWDDDTFNVPLTGAKDDASANIENGLIILSTAEVAQLFHPLVNRVIELVERQRNLVVAYGKTAQGVMLVGGFGQSKYLFRSLKLRFADDDPPPEYTQLASEIVSDGQPRFLVIQPVHAWTAVVRGAVLSGLAGGFVTSRKARRHYGITTNKHWSAFGTYTVEKFWEEIEEVWLVKNQMSWHVNTGQTMPVDEPILLDFYRTWSIEEGFPTLVSTKICYNEEESAPQEKTTGTAHLCTLSVDLESVPHTAYETKTTLRGKYYRQLDYKIGMRLNSGSLEFFLQVDGVVYGNVKADYK
ncbi:actin-like ATPase domain-containing protein, partial [Aureobasidium pullulans]